MRKVLSFVLVLALVLSSFSMAFAADTTSTGLTDVSGNANADAIQVAYDLGIVTGNPDGTFTPEKAVNRAEFAAMLTRALDIPASALAGYTTTSFKDTTGYTWAVPYLAFCQSKGILLGDGNGNVMPGQTITVNQAMTMALRAIGYTSNSSLLVGAWPANYVSIAQNVSLYDDVATDTTVNKASAAQIIYNLLTVQKVAVNTDGTTDYLWDGKEADGIEANLLNTNLGCTSDEDVTLGKDYSYDDAIINITNDLGAYGTAYLNDDDELVAFTKDSTALTGKINDDGDGFEVGDVTYDIDDSDLTDSDNDTTKSAFFANTDVVTSNTDATIAGIEAFASAKSNDGETVTLNVDLSGKTIKDVYSVVAWLADDKDLAASDVQDDIADSSLLGEDFVQNDNDVIDTNSFGLSGVASLDKIAEDNVVYVYVDNDGDIRKVEVGTETVVGTVDEYDTDDETITVGGTEYDLAPATIAAVTIADFDTDSEGTFYLDVNGEVYDFDGTNATDTYAIVKAIDGTSTIDNFKVKLYQSDDATSTYYFSEDTATDIDWTTCAGTTAAQALALVHNPALVGYSLNSAGEIDGMNVTASTSAVNNSFQSTKVMKFNNVSYSIDSSAVVFTYDDVMTNTSDYDVCTLKDVDTGALTSPVAIMLNEDGDVAAMFIDSSNADVNQDAVYGVINKKTTTKDSGDDTVFKFSGYIDGTAFTYTTSDDSNGGTHATGGTTGYNGLVSVFGVYSITLDASNAISEISDLTALYNDTTGDSGIIQTSLHSELVTDISSDSTVFTTASGKYTAADDAVVYKYDVDDETYTVSKLSTIDKGDEIALYDTKGDDADGIASVVIFIAN